jgi:hypothetical protein
VNSPDVSIYQKITSRNPADINASIEADFLQHQNDPAIKKTHLFAGRYENIYLDERQVPALKPLLNEALALARNILKLSDIRAGYWFNDMPPGATTTLHTHDDDDELLSCVYYVRVPQNSGNLIIYDDADSDGQRRIEIESSTGDFIFFKPDVRHEVTKNNSSEHRLSVAFNFGVTREGDDY